MIGSTMRPRGRAVFAWLVSAGLVLLAGCAGLGQKLESPNLSLLGIQMMSTDVFAQKFRMRVKVENPNDLELPVRGIDYEVFLMGDSFAEGSTADRFTVPAKGEAEFDMIVTTNFVSSLGRLISRVGGGKLEDLDYDIKGELLLDKGFVKKIPFSRHGKVDISKALAGKGHGG